MFNEYVKKSQQLIDQGRSFVIALVVNYKAPISGKPGDRAIITEDGSLWGWVAGGCSRSIIIDEALNVLRTGESKVIRITPDIENPNEDIMTHKMTCHSGGTLDVYLEPVIPVPQIVILGGSAVADKLKSLANALDYQVLTKLDITKMNRPENIYIVVSTQGDGDEQALKKAIDTNPSYLGFVASKKKALKVKEILSTQGIAAEKLEKIKAPAGLDINARSSQEIALSILAEIVMVSRAAKIVDESVSEKAIDPICGMRVSKQNAKHVFDYQGNSYYFCCEGCKTIFSTEPEKYVEANV